MSSKTMPVTAVACAVGAAVLLSGSVGASSGPVRSAECLACKVLAKDLVDLGENATDVKTVIAELQAACDKKLANHTVEMKICDKIVAGLVELLPFIDNEIAKLAWDSDNLCAIAGLCKVNCCLDPRPTQPEQVCVCVCVCACVRACVCVCVCVCVCDVAGGVVAQRSWRRFA